MSRSMSARETVTALLEPVVRSAGYDLEEVSLAPAGRRRLLRVVVDRDGGLDLDGVAEVSRAVAAALDETDALGPAPYLLEVSSPGVDRPLREPRHWRRAVGRLVRVPLAGSGTVTGRVREVTAETVLLELAGETRSCPYADLGPGAVQVEFGGRTEEGGGS